MVRLGLGLGAMKSFVADRRQRIPGIGCQLPAGDTGVIMTIIIIITNYCVMCSSGSKRRRADEDSLRGVQTLRAGDGSVPELRRR